MKKKDIFNKLSEITSGDFVVIGDASIVCHGLKRECDNISIYSNDNINVSDIEVIVGEVNSYDLIDGYKFMKLEDCMNLKILEDEIGNKAIIKKIKLYLETLDNYKYERDLRKTGITLIGGVDEVGRGPLVGPVVAACCVLPENFNLDGLTDSKKLSEKKRDFFFEEIKKQAITYGIGIVSEKRIDEINIYQATKEAMIMAINQCDPKPEYVLTDAMKLDIDIPITPIIKGDLKSITISAASVLAKVTRDRMMYELDKKYPMYDFKSNVGYPTKKHLEAIEKYGIIPEHRRSYGPVADYLEGKDGSCDS